MYSFSRLLVCVLAVGTSLALAGQARAFACSDTHTISVGESSFTDCAGKSIEYEFEDGEIELEFEGTWNPGNGNPGEPGDWFSDLHVTFLDLSGNPLFDDSTGSICDDDCEFEKEEDTEWATSAMDNMVWFIAEELEDRIFPGDEYEWEVEASFSPTSMIKVQIDYTMDVPEPALGVALMSGLAAIGLARRRTR